MMRTFRPRHCVRCEQEFLPTAPSSKWCSLMCRLLDGCDRTGGDDACWPWQRMLDKKGYGQLTVLGRYDRAGTSFFAHRIMFELTNGLTLSPDVKVLHTCDNPPCINPKHLVSGTQADNVRHMIIRGRAQYNLNKVKGSTHHGALIDEITARDIFQSTLSMNRAAKHFGVSRDIVNHIRTGRTWTHVTGLPRKLSPRARNRIRWTGIGCGLLSFGA
jgi:hypothetical protein